MRNSFLKTISSHNTLIVDGNSGEILEQDIKKIKYLANSKEQFFIFYASLIGILQQMTSPEVKVYAYIIEHYLSDSEIALPKGMKQVIADKLKIKLGTVNNTISSLCEKRLLYTTHRAIYKINPRYAFKGSTKHRNHLLKVVLELECPEC